MLKIKSGLGYDIHKIKKNGNMFIGGIKVSNKYSFIAHSDGDVLIHALVDSLLGAIGYNDIGELFPDNDNKYKDIDSKELLKKVKNILNDKGYEIMNIDCVIISEIIKINKFKDDIRKTISNILDIPYDDFNVKGKSKEGLDSVGRGEAIECFCSSMVRK